MTFSELIDGSRIVYIPIYSMFDHQTGLFDSECDGNINRWMTNFYKNKMRWKHLRVFGPSEDLFKSRESYDKFINTLDTNFERLAYVPFHSFRGGAKMQRTRVFADDFVDDFKSLVVDEDLVIVESQALFDALHFIKAKTNRNFKLVYWCPVCETNHKTRSFFNKDDKMKNEEIFKKADFVIVATDEQARYLDECKVSKDKVILVKEFIVRSLPMFSSYIRDFDTLKSIDETLGQTIVGIYLPFRLSDEGYRLWDIVDTVYPHMINDNAVVGKAIVYSPNINGSTINELVDMCVKNGSKLDREKIQYVLKNIRSVSPSRSTYYTLIDCCDKLVIPYFEDYSFVMHAAVDELIRGKTKCTVLTTKEELAQYLDDFNRISSFSVIDNILKKKDHMDRIFKAIVRSSSFKNLFLKCSSSFGSELPSFIFTGVGKNWYVCEKVVKVFISLGIRAQALDCMHALHGDLGMLDAEKSAKVLVYVSRSGTTAELVKLAKIVKQFKDKKIINNLETVGFFLNKELPNKQLFDQMIVPDDLTLLNDIYEFDDRDLVPSLSIDILQLALDLLGVLLYEGRPELVEHYIYNHLSGANGMKLGGAAILNNID
nr:MAG TPA: hypothetical protein [Caudoviricetes sp.]